MGVNFQLVFDKTLEAIARAGERPRLLLHSCCGPCSTAVLEVLAEHFDLTVLFFNPNIYPEAEYKKRAETQCRLLADMPLKHHAALIVPDYQPQLFEAVAVGYREEREGGGRCRRCFELRLTESARYAKENGFDYFTTTLSVSPHKDAQLLNSLGAEIGDSLGVKFLHADFKKREGYKRSIALSQQYNLYRQSYCGCRYSLEAQKDNKNTQ